MTNRYGSPAMNVIGATGSDPHRTGTDVPGLRALLALTATIGLALATALGIAAILGASLSATAIRLLGSGTSAGFDGLFAVGAATLYQRSRPLRAAAAIG